MDDPKGTTTYFGKVTSISKNELVLIDIYYLTTDETAPEAINALKNPQLTKLGEGQLHQPEDKMIINRQHVAFMENMTDEAPVVQAILEHKNK